MLDSPHSPRACLAGASCCSRQVITVAVRINHTPQVAGLHYEMERTLVFIDDALDRGDRRDFRKWTLRWRSLSERLASLLTVMARD